MIAIDKRHFRSKQDFHLELYPIGNLKSFMSGPPVAKETLVLISTIHRRLAQLRLTISTIHRRVAQMELTISTIHRRVALKELTYPHFDFQGWRNYPICSQQSMENSLKICRFDMI